MTEAKERIANETCEIQSRNACWLNITTSIIGHLDLISTSNFQHILTISSIR